MAKFANFLRKPPLVQWQWFTPPLGSLPREWNPWLRIGRFEICVDKDGFCVHTKRRTFGYIIGAGWHNTKFYR
jgi:hypothetical protein